MTGSSGQVEIRSLLEVENRAIRRCQVPVARSSEVGAMARADMVPFVLIGDCVLGFGLRGVVEIVEMGGCEGRERSKMEIVLRWPARKCEPVGVKAREDADSQVSVGLWIRG